MIVQHRRALARGQGVPVFSNAPYTFISHSISNFFKNKQTSRYVTVAIDTMCEDAVAEEMADREAFWMEAQSVSKTTSISRKKTAGFF